MYTQNSNRAWKRALAPKPCNRAARRNTGRVYSRPYVVTTAAGVRKMLRSATTPEGFSAVMGPFKTTRGAQFVLDNPGDHTVATAERHAADFQSYLNRYMAL